MNCPQNLEQTVQIDGVQFIPLPETPEELRQKFSSIFQGNEEYVLGQTFIRLKVTKKPAYACPSRVTRWQKVRRSQKDKHHNYDDFFRHCHRGWQWVDNLLASASIVLDGDVKATHHWYSTNILNCFTTDLARHLGYTDYRRGIKSTPANTSKMKEIEDFSHRLRDVKDTLSIPIEYWELSKHSGEAKISAVHVGTALESLYMSDTNNSEISYKLALRAAWHLGKTLEKRQCIFKMVRDLYAARSSVVHTGNFSRKHRKRAELEYYSGYSTVAEKIVADGKAIVRQAIQKIVKEGKPTSWNDLVLGSEQQ